MYGKQHQHVAREDGKKTMVYLDFSPAPSLSLMGTLAPSRLKALLRDSVSGFLLDRLPRSLLLLSRLLLEADTRLFDDSGYGS